jgi:hypothetical protein
MVLESRIATHGEDETDHGCLGTAMHAVHAIAPVCAAAPGVRTFLDLPTIVARAYWTVEPGPILNVATRHAGTPSSDSESAEARTADQRVISTTCDCSAEPIPSTLAQPANPEE